MTTIAWDGKTLAADRCSWSHGVRRQVSKLARIRTTEGSELLSAMCGGQDFCVQARKWVQGLGERPNPKDYDAPLDAACLVIVNQEKKVWLLSNTLVWLPFEESFFAFGAGQEFAWGALEAGANAEQAVEIAARRSDYAGFGVDTLTF